MFRLFFLQRRNVFELPNSSLCVVWPSWRRFSRANVIHLPGLVFTNMLSARQRLRSEKKNIYIYSYILCHHVKFFTKVVKRPSGDTGPSGCSWLRLGCHRLLLVARRCFRSTRLLLLLHKANRSESEDYHAGSTNSCLTGQKQ